MNLIISGDNPKNLAKIEALAREMGLLVSRELTSSSGSGKVPRRLPDNKVVETADSDPGKKVKGKSSSRGPGPLYGIE